MLLIGLGVDRTMLTYAMGVSVGYTINGRSIDSTACRVFPFLGTSQLSASVLNVVLLT